MVTLRSCFSSDYLIIFSSSSLLSAATAVAASLESMKGEDNPEISQASILKWLIWTLSGETSISSGIRNRGSMTMAHPKQRSHRFLDPPKVQIVNQEVKLPSFQPKESPKLPEGAPLITNSTKILILQEIEWSNSEKKKRLCRYGLWVL